MSNPEEPHYGDSCFVGHSGKLLNKSVYEISYQRYAIANKFTCHKSNSQLNSTVEEESNAQTWWRGCKLNVNKTNECWEHKFMYHEQEYVVDECICDTKLCNKDMSPIPETTTKGHYYFISLL